MLRLKGFAGMAYAARVRVGAGKGRKPRGHRGNAWEQELGDGQPVRARRPERSLRRRDTVGVNPADPKNWPLSPLASEQRFPTICPVRI
jgi:hypothetical protein